MTRLLNQSFAILLPVLFVGWGIATTHWDILHEGHIPGDLGDARFNHLILEHNFQTSYLAFGEYWSPKWAFHPEKNTLAYSDNLFAAAWPYEVLRALGGNPIQAYQGWFLLCSVLNFLAMLICTRFVTKSMLAASAAAYLFAFALPRSDYLYHAQMLPQFYSPLCVLALIFFIRDPRPRYLFAAALAIVAQIWAGIYLGWFLGFAVGLGFCLPYWRNRRSYHDYVREHWRSLAGILVCCVILMVPLAITYGEVSLRLGSRSWWDVRHSLPSLTSYLMAPGNHWLYKQVLNFDMLGFLSPLPKHNLIVMFCGILPLVALWYTVRYRVQLDPTTKFMLYLLGALVLVSFGFYHSVTIWQIVYGIVPGAGAIRVVCRIVFVMLIPLSLLVAHFVSRLESRNQIIALLFVLGLIAENTYSSSVNYDPQDHIDRIDRVERAVKTRSADCRQFFWQSDDQDYAVHIDAMWASLNTRVPTVNGYSGNYPEGWDFRDPSKATAQTLESWSQGTCLLSSL